MFQSHDPKPDAGDARVKPAAVKRKNVLGASIVRRLGKTVSGFNVAGSIENMKSLAVNLLMIFSALLALPISYKIVARNALTINEFSVPAGLEGRGLSGKVLAQRLHDEIVAASRFTSRQIETQGVTPVALEQKLPQIDLPVEGLNLALVVRQLRGLFGFRDSSISGELIVEQDAQGGRPEKYGLRLRAPGEGAIYRSEAPTDNVDFLLRDAAIVIIQREDPIVAAYYYMFRRDYKAARRMADIASVSSDAKTQLLATNVKGLIARGMNDWEEAATYFRAVINSNPDFRVGYVNLAAVLRRYDVAEAEVVGNETVARFPDYWISYSNLAFIRLSQRRVPEATEAMAKAEALAPRDPEMFFYRHFFERSLGQYEAAIATLQLAQDLNPLAIHYYEEAVRLRRDLGHLNEAMQAARRITAIEPTNPQGYAIVARIALDSRDFDNAESAIGKALSFEPDYAPALAERGRLFTLREKWLEAEAAFSEAERADPRLSEAWEYLGDYLSLRNRPQEAIAALRKAVNFGIYPGWRATDPGAKLGRLLAASGDLAGAIEIYERVLRLDRRKYAHLAGEIERLNSQLPAKP